MLHQTPAPALNSNKTCKTKKVFRRQYFPAHIVVAFFCYLSCPELCPLVKTIKELLMENKDIIIICNWAENQSQVKMATTLNLIEFAHIDRAYLFMRVRNIKNMKMKIKMKMNYYLCMCQIVLQLISESLSPKVCRQKLLESSCTAQI